MITIRLDRVAPGQVSFGYCPAQEAMHSLYVLLHAKRYPLHIQWVVKARQRLSAELKAEIEAFRFFFQAGMPLCWDLRKSAALFSFGDEIAEFRVRDARGYLEDVVRFTIGGPGQALPDLSDVAAILRKVPPEHAEVVRAAFDNPDRSKERFADMLEAYWENCLAEAWPSIEETFVRDIERRGRLLMRRGVTAVLEQIAPNVRSDLNAKVCTIRSLQTLEWNLSEHNKIWLMPSWFVWPNLLIGQDPHQLVITYPVRDQQMEGRPPVPPEELLKLLRAAGDMTRLQILQLLAKRERSTTELAGLIGITDASISKHLKQLQEAGLVEAQRQSYYVFYHLVWERLGEIGPGLEMALRAE